MNCESKFLFLFVGTIKIHSNDEVIPTDWKMGLLAKLPKKGNLSECNTSEGIKLLSIDNKVPAGSSQQEYRPMLKKDFKRVSTANAHVATK